VAEGPESKPLDLVILGGGITGAGIARLAARNGLAVALVERGDLASGASSASSHMLHGGLRYLEHGRLNLVRESLIERAALSRMAPSLARPRRFLVPLYRGDRVGPFRLRVGLSLYDFLAGSRGLAPHVMARPRDALELEPQLAPQGLLGAGIYSDVVMDDARVVVAVARDAAAHGAEIHTWTEPVAARRSEAKEGSAPGGIALTVRDRLDGAERTLVARLLINATGSWSDATRRWLAASMSPGSPPPAPALRPSRGTHLIYPPLTRGHGLLLTARADGRVFFVVPFADWSLVGTTELEVPSPPPDRAFLPTLEEVAYLRAELGRAMPEVADVPPIAAFAGLRPLLHSSDSIGHASREHRVIDEAPVITIAGGKYTTFRVMARDTLAVAARRLGRRVAIHDSDDPLPSPLTGPATAERIADHAIDFEFARRIEDVLRRRTTLWLAADRGRIPARLIAERMAQRLGWSAERTREEVALWDGARYEDDVLLERTRQAG
jgi:glycerol-3-phosphate dehydrogenase